MIDGVQIKTLVTHADDRGYFREIVRDDEQLLSHFGQASVTQTFPGVIKAFHWHEKQDDLWYVVRGHAQVVLYDRRTKSGSFQQTQVIYAGDELPMTIFIPHGVAHGYRVLGDTPVTLVYLTTASYNLQRPDEHRIPWDDAEIGFDWSTRNR